MKGMNVKHEKALFDKRFLENDTKIGVQAWGPLNLRQYRVKQIN